MLWQQGWIVVTEMIWATCPQSLKAWLSDPLQSRFVDPDLIHLGFAPQETKAQRRTKTWRDTLPSLDHKLPDCPHAVVHLASWLARKGIMETPGRAHPLVYWKPEQKCCWPTNRPILPWRKPLLRGKGSTLGWCRIMPTTPALMSAGGVTTSRSVFSNQSTSGWGGGTLPLGPSSVWWTWLGTASGDKVWTFLKEKAGEGSHFHRLFSSESLPMLNASSFIILLSVLFEACHWILRTVLQGRKLLWPSLYRGGGRSLEWLTDLVKVTRPVVEPRPEWGLSDSKEKSYVLEMREDCWHRYRLCPLLFFFFDHLGLIHTHS